MSKATINIDKSWRTNRYNNRFSLYSFGPLSSYQSNFELRKA